MNSGFRNESSRTPTAFLVHLLWHCNRRARDWNVLRCAHRGFSDGWQGIPIYLAAASILGRIANCKVILLNDALLVVNPLRTHSVPKTLIREAWVDNGGTLEVNLGEDQNVSVFAFGGSLIDHFKGSSREAARTINRWLNTPCAIGEARNAHQVRWTRSRYADISLVLCAVISGAGALWMALTG